MNDALFTLRNVSHKPATNRAPQTPLEHAGCGKKKAVMGYDTYPAFKPEEAARRRARRLLDQKSSGEANAVGQNADNRK